jgi:hypothetical protein
VSIKIALEVTRTWPTLEITPVHDDEFSVCFAKALRHRPFGRVDKRIAATLTLTLHTPRQILARAIEQAFTHSFSCIPRAGAVPSSVRVDIGTDDGVVAVTATTTPSNTEVDGCSAEHIRGTLEELDIGTGVWKPTAHVTRSLSPVVTSSELKWQVDFLARDAAVECYGPFDELPRVRFRVTVTAKRDEEDFAIAVSSGEAQRDACTGAALHDSLHDYFERDGHFRIDGNARTSLTFGLEPAEKHSARTNAYYQRRYKYSLGE